MNQLEIHVDNLLLDPKNPRLPQGQPGDQESLLSYILAHGSLRELADSFVDNGFFQAERLIVIEAPEAPGKYTVVEGNRRLATLKILHGELGDIGLSSEEPTEEQLHRLREIPCLVVDTREEVDEYLAYRHIGGMKTWSAEARARFTRHMVDNERSKGDENPFKTVGRQVGSNAQAIRNSYLAITVLEHARSELSMSTDYLQFDRFGVWIRCMNSADIRSFVGIENPKTYEEVQATLASLKVDELREVVADLSPRSDGRRPLVADSRDITDYGRILKDPVAYTALRRHEDFEIASQIVERRSLPSRMDRISNMIEAIVAELSLSSDEADHDLLVQAERLFGASRSLRAIVKDLTEIDD